ncbi:MAG: hypothetical protein O2931_03905 [Planctomycetota bacterium]|nr:hypothetical protein [Planctomycetota bacterium]MDA1177923.1 hypothetical protein [Planctomycetota bacterium]
MRDHKTLTPPSHGSGVPWTRGQRWFASLLILFHVTAVVLGVWGAVPPFSRMNREASVFFQPYLQATYLNHGYRFFAPNPEASHLIRYEVRKADGELIAAGQWPDPIQHWPRLHYHRHLMIAETLFVLTNSPPIDTVPAEDRDGLLAQRELAKKLVAGIQRSLQARHGTGKVTLFLMEHTLAAPQDVANGRLLTDPSLYLERSLEELLETKL